MAQLLPPDTMIYNKMTFGLASPADILEAVRNTNRKTAVLIGYETDVCVRHSASGLVNLGYRVAVVADTTGSPEKAHQIDVQAVQSGRTIRTEIFSYDRVSFAPFEQAKLSVE